MKKLLSVLLSFAMLVTVAFSTELVPESMATFDLTKSGVQTIHTFDAEGNEVTITAKKVEPPISLFDEDLNYGASSWVVSYTSIVSYANFTMDVYINSNGIATITDVYDGEYFITLYEVTSSDLRINRATETSTRSAQAEYYFEGTLVGVGAGSTNGWLRGDVKDMRLTVSFK